MPAKYTAMKRKFKKQGMSEDAAQTKAAKLYNSQRKSGEPVLDGAEYDRKIQRRRVERKAKKGLKKAFSGGY